MSSQVDSGAELQPKLHLVRVKYEIWHLFL